MKTKILLMFIIANFFLKLFAQLPAPSLQIQNVIQTEIEAFKNALLNQNNIDVPGFMIKIEKVGEWEYTWKKGVSNIQNSTPLSNDQTFRIGNISETFLAVAVLKLVHNGQINLSDPITTWLPLSVTSAIPNASSITIQQLLQQSSGIRDNLEAVIVGGDPTSPPIVVQWYTDNFLTNFSFNDIMNYYAQNNVAVAMPNNQFFNLSGINYLLLGKIIQNCSGLTWQQYVTQNIIQPLNLINTFCPNDNDLTLPSNFISGYESILSSTSTIPDIVNFTVINSSIYKSSREIISNLDDLIVFWKAVRNAQILPQNLSDLSQNCSLTIESDTSNFPAKFGLACVELKESSFEGQDWIGNIGNIEGYGSGMIYLPKYNAYMTAVSNYYGHAAALMGVIDLIMANVLNLSTNQIEINNSFKVYPNPAKNILNISNDLGNLIDKIEICDISGKKVIESLENKNQINIENLQSGIYFLNIKSNSKKFQSKFVKD